MDFHQFRKKIKLSAIIIPVVLLAIIVFIIKEWQTDKDATKYYLAADTNELIASRDEVQASSNNTTSLPAKSDKKEEAVHVQPSMDKQSALIISCRRNESLTSEKTNQSETELTGVDLEKKLSDFQESEDFEEKLAYAISITRSQQASINLSKIDTLQQLTELQSNNKLAHWSLITACSHNPENKNCGETAVNKALEADGSNGALWLNIAILQATNKNAEKTFQALQEVVAAPTYHEYISEQISLYDNVTSKLGFDNPKDRIVQVMGQISAIEIGNLSALLNFCQQQSVQRTDIAQTCIDVGRKLTNMGESYLSRSIGTTIQKQVYQIQGSDTLLDNLSEQEENISRAWSNERYQKAMDLLNYDNDLLLDWFQKYKTYGERVATDYLVDEAIRLSMDADYNPCPDNTYKVGESN